LSSILNFGDNSAEV